MAGRTAPTTAQLRYGIASGRARDKVSNIDPAAAPLGTDDEAAGKPPSGDEIHLATQEELRSEPVPSQPFELWPIIALVGAAILLAIAICIGAFFAV